MSIELTNLTPFANMRFSNLDKHGKEYGVFMAKGAWDIPESGECTLCEEQEPFVFTDEYFGEPNFSALQYPSDFVPYKPVTDVILNATAWAPEGKPAKSWLVGVKVTDGVGTIVMKALRIVGPRYWVPQWKRELTEQEKTDWKQYRHLFKGWELSEPEPIAKLPVRYEYAFGGMYQNGTHKDGSPRYELVEENPVGRGWIHPELTDHTRPIPAPQIEDPDDPVRDPYKRYEPLSFGPIPPSWLPRRPLGGTYDQNWLDNIHPNWPPDYDFAYHNSASGSLRAKTHLTGNLKFELVGLHPIKRHWHFILPELLVSALAVSSSEEAGADRTATELFSMNADTIYMDICEEQVSDPCAYQTWRLPFKLDKYENIILSQFDEQKRELFLRKNKISRAPYPHDVSIFS